ncbi:MAG: sulfotransferase family protein [Symploca sp. SIO1C2]|nr:sulfotransferase family protein [Symploca sp. SIO1C2]
MLISYQYNFIFIHVYKVAGTSIESALNKYTLPPYESTKTKNLQQTGHLPCSENFRGHIKAREVRSELGDETFDRFFKFAFVRNPWDWEVSLYQYMLQTQEHPQHELINSMAGFAEYLEWRISKEKISQKPFVSDQQGNIIVDFVGRYENLQADFQKVCHQLGITEALLPHLNRSQHLDYREYYNEYTQKLIFEHFQEDIELFGYDFGGNRKEQGVPSFQGWEA